MVRAIHCLQRSRALDISSFSLALCCMTFMEVEAEDSNVII